MTVPGTCPEARVHASAWALTCALSPRLRVRVAATTASGEVLNSYPRHAQTSGPVPEQPWAVYLADTSGQFRLLAFDLDATKQGRAAVERDADVLAGLLNDAGLSHVVCESGPSGGRHLWVRLAADESVAAEMVATLARLAGALCPSLDRAPLSNPATGCVRPPGTPHRHGGASRVLTGDLAVLTRPTATAAQVRHLIELIAGQVDVHHPGADIDARTPLPLDDHGHRYLPGPRRPLPAACAEALAEDAAAGDASAVLWRVLIGAAAARWHHSDIAALAASAPGLEHVRTCRDRSARRPRPAQGPESPAAVLRRQWDRAVRYVATSTRRTGTDPTWDTRAGALAAHVREVQARADAAPGRWTHHGGPTDRRVLDVLCVLALQAVTTTIEADIRRLALHAGIGRETARTALHRLAADAWIAPVQAAAGPHGATWTIDPQALIPTSSDQERSQADPRPVGAGSAERSTLLTSLLVRLTAATHDVFTRTGLGFALGNTYARVSAQAPVEDEDLVLTGDATAARRILDRLVNAGLLYRNPRGQWRLYRSDRRTTVAKQLGVHGVLADRARRYTLERVAWAWWQAETIWMSTPHSSAAKRRRPGPGQLLLLAEPGTNIWGAHPRRPNGRADFSTARRILDTDQPQPATPAASSSDAA